ncbi:MAG TPA: alanine racemase [Caulobacteraceae bacterium]|nr:alanine racemase [Caulobacteraceae bacterium]
MSAARLTIDLDALARNHAALAAAAPGAEIAPVVKSDGYGLGAAIVGRRLWAEGARSFFVARLAEGQDLRRALGDRAARIYVLDGVGPDDAGPLAEADLTPVINSLACAWRWRPTGRPAALHVDTGMNRLGLAAADVERVRDLPIAHVMSHLACAAAPDDALNGQQRERFAAVRALFPDARASLAASAGIFLGEAYWFDAVRPGICLYGGGPRERPDPRFAAVARLEAPILQLRDLKAGDFVSYGRAFVADRPMRIALVAAGYTDGFIRGAARGKASVCVGGVAARVLTVSMDMLAVDVSDATCAREGDPVELLGQNAPLDDLAAAAGTVAHECLVRLSSRAERVYVGAVD